MEFHSYLQDKLGEHIESEVPFYFILNIYIIGC
jgi:hypothetical protein